MDESVNQKPLSKRDDILRAAKELLWERGYEATSPRDIMDRSGAGQGSLYHHFDGKLALALVALQAIADEEIAEIDKIFAVEKRPRRKIEDYLSRERQALRGCRMARLAYEGAMEDERFRAPIAECLQRIEDHLRDALAQMRSEGSVPIALESEKLAATFLAVVEGGFILARVFWNEQKMRDALDGARDLLHALALR